MILPACCRRTPTCLRADRAARWEDAARCTNLAARLRERRAPPIQAARDARVGRGVALAPMVLWALCGKEATATGCKLISGSDWIGVRASEGAGTSSRSCHEELCGCTALVGQDKLLCDGTALNTTDTLPRRRTALFPPKAMLLRARPVRAAYAKQAAKQPSCRQEVRACAAPGCCPPLAPTLTVATFAPGNCRRDARGAWPLSPAVMKPCPACRAHTNRSTAHAPRERHADAMKLVGIPEAPNATF